MTPPRVFVSGAAGFIGSALVEWCAQRQPVMANVRSPHPSKIAPHKNITLFEHDWSGRLDPERIPDVQVLVHSAFNAPSLPRWKGHTGEALALNQLIATNVAEAATKMPLRGVILLSSGSVYAGGPTAVSPSSQLVLQTENSYGYSCLEVEKIFTQKLAHVPLVIVRLFYPYGPGQSADRLIPRLVQRILREEPIILSRSSVNEASFGHPRISPVYISDVSKYLGILLNRVPSLPIDRPHILNLGGREVVSIKEISEILGELLKKSPRFTFDSQSRAEDLFPDSSGEQSLGIHDPPVSLRAGLSLTIEGKVPV